MAAGQPDPTPLSRFLPIARDLDVQLTALLLDAANDAVDRLGLLEARQGVGAQVRRAQYAQVRAELLKTARALYAGAGTTLEQAAAAAGQAAADAATFVDTVLFREFGHAIPSGLAAAHRAQAQNTIKQYLARTSNGIPLSRQVYHTQLLSRGLIDRQINLSILLGESWKELADRVRSSILPGVRGGVAYAAKRLGRTEINNAFHTAQVNSHRGEPWIEGMLWNLSGSHPRPDECDDYAKSRHFDGGDPGVFQKENVPNKPHPQCLCYLTAETVDEDSFVNGFLRGDWDAHLDRVLATH